MVRNQLIMDEKIKERILKYEQWGPHLFHGSLDCVSILKFLAPVDCMKKYVIQIHWGIVYKIVTPSSDFRGINATFVKKLTYAKKLTQITWQTQNRSNVVFKRFLSVFALNKWYNFAYSTI